MKIVGIIPARYKSSRFPGKPLADICGKPMIWWVYNQAKKVSAFDEVYVATDDKLIFDTCSTLEINVLMTSDKHPTGTDRLGEAAELVKADFYVNIQGDEPLIEPETIQRIVDYKIANPEVEVINSMTEYNGDPTINTIVKAVAADNDSLLYLSRSPIPYPKNGQQIQYYKHLGLYGLSKEALLFFSNAERTRNEKIEDVEMLRFLENGYNIKIVKVNSNSVGVDVPSDIDKVVSTIKDLGLKV